MSIRYKVVWDEENPRFFRTKKKAVDYLEKCAGVAIERIDTTQNKR